MPVNTGKSRTAIASPLLLVPVAGPPLKPITVKTNELTVLGRSREATVVLADPTVSRRHASIALAGGRWLLTDLNSRHGVLVNGTAIEAGVQVLIDEGDLIHVGPWTLRVGVSSTAASFVNTTDDYSEGEDRRVQKVARHELENMAQHRLQVLLDCAEQINSATDEDALAEESLRSALSGTGYQRAAMLKPTGTESELIVVGYHDDRGSDVSNASFSRSLVHAAASGELVRMTGEAMVTGQSIVDLHITQALCAPIMIGGTVVSYLYLDVRDRSAPIEEDAAAFCQAIARLCGLALSNIKHIALQSRQQRIEGELAAARQAQQLIMPAEQGTSGSIRYALRTHPGSFVAGDLFDIQELGDGRTAVCIGDVAGEGAGAAVLMAAAQSHLHSALRKHRDLAEAIIEVNRYVSARSAANRFITMWVGVFESETGVLQYVDAGHGHWIHKPANGSAMFVEHTGGLLVGIDSEFEYEIETLNVSKGDRLVLYSDGVIEQQSPEGEFFGNDRLLDIVNASGDEVQDVESALAAVKAFAGGQALADDTTVASVLYQP